MSSMSPVNVQHSRNATGTYFDYIDAAALRNMAMTAGVDLPCYLLAPEISLLLSYLPDLRQRLLIETLWNTGARINEALALTPSDFHLENGIRPFVVLRTLKQRTRGKGRPKKEEALKRIVPLLDALFVQRLGEYFATVRPNKYDPLWAVASDETPRNWLKAAIDRARRDAVTFSFEQITPKTFRHSYAMHLIQSHIPLKVVQAYMGHKELSSTEVYTRIFALDVGANYGVCFSLPVDQATHLLSTSCTAYLR